MRRKRENGFVPGVVKVISIKIIIGSKNMKRKSKILIVIIIGFILTWAPWLNSDQIKAKTYEDRAKIDGTLEAGCDYDYFIVIPLGRYIASCESGYIITFWGQVLP